MSFNEQDRGSGQLRGRGWHRLLPPRRVQCYVAGIWLDAPVTEVSEETREVRIEYPTVAGGVRRLILDASQYRPSPGLFPGLEREGDPLSTGPAAVSATSTVRGGPGSQS